MELERNETFYLTAIERCKKNIAEVKNGNFCAKETEDLVKVYRNQINVYTEKALSFYPQEKLEKFETMMEDLALIEYLLHHPYLENQVFVGDTAITARAKVDHSLLSLMKDIGNDTGRELTLKDYKDLEFPRETEAVIASTNPLQTATI